MYFINIWGDQMNKFKLKKAHFVNGILATLGIFTVVLFISFLHRIFISPSVDPYVNAGSSSKKKEVIQINVLNACGVDGLASKAKEYLRRRGFDVVETGNYSEVLNKSVICDRVGDLKSADKVAYAMGISNKSIISQVDSSLYIRTSVIIGNDFFELKPFN